MLHRCSASCWVSQAFSTIGPINPKTITLLLHLKSACEKISELVELLHEHVESNLLVSLTRMLQEPATVEPGSGDSPEYPSGASIGRGEYQSTDAYGSVNQFQSVASMDQSVASIAGSSIAGSAMSEILPDTTAVEAIRRAIDTKIGADAHAARAAVGDQCHAAAPSCFSLPPQR